MQDSKFKTWFNMDFVILSITICPRDQCLTSQVLSAIQAMQVCMNFKFTREDFLKGKVGEKIISEDFDFDKM